MNDTAPVVWTAPLRDEVWSVGVRGRLDHNAVPQLESALRELAAAGHVRLMVDMELVSYINSGGLRVLISAWRAARREGGDLQLCRLNPRVNDIFRMAGFDQVFRIHDLPSDAVCALLNEPAVP